MKKAHIGVILIVLCAAALAAAYCVSRPDAAHDAGAALYDTDGVRVGFGLHAKATSVRQAETSVVQISEELYDVTIDDGRGEPIIIAFQASCCNGVVVQAVTDRVVALRVMPGVGIGTSEFYVAERETREVRHYLLDSTYLATTSDGAKIVLLDEKGIVVQDSALSELQRTAFAPADEYASIALASPDDRYVAFLTWNGQHDEFEKWRAYAYDLEKNEVKDLGSAAEAGNLRWNDATTFTTLMESTDGSPARAVSEFKIPSP